MADRTVIVEVGARVTGFVSGMKTATQAAQDFTSKGLASIGKNEQHLRSLSTQAGVAGLALTGLAVLAVKKFAEFDKQMSAVAATGEDAAASLEGLTNAALDAGRQTAFGATEAARGIEELLKAGVSAKDVLGGGLKGALNLAAAGELAVGDAAEIAATAMTQFKLKGSDVNHVADLLASGASKAQGGVGDLGMALKQAGLVANQTGLSIEETTAGLTAFASAGLIGSDAGTSFKSMLQRLTPQSQEAQKAMDTLGISAYDAQGNFIGLAEFAGNLQSALIKLTPEQRNAALATIFGSDAVRAASVLYDEGESGIRKWIAAVDDQGFAAETAATRLDNLAGDLKILQGSIETALIGLGSSADGPLRSLVQNVTDLVNAFSDAPSEIQNVTLGIIGTAGLVLLGVAGLGKLLIMVNNVREAFVAMKVSASLAAGAAGGLALAGLGIGLLVSRIADAAAKTRELRESLDQVTGAATESTAKIVAAGFTARQTLLGFEFNTSVADDAKNLGIGLEQLTDAAVNGGPALDKLNERLDTFKKNTPENQARAEKLGLSWVDLSDNAKRVEGAVADQSDKLDVNGEKVRDVAEAVAATGVAQDEFGAATADATVEVKAQVDILEELVNAQAEAAGKVLSQRDAQRNFQQAIDDATAALEENGAGLDINTEAGRKNQAALDDIAKSGEDVITSMQANGASQEELTATMAVTRDAFITAATQMGLTADEANALADEMHLIPEAITPVVTLDTRDVYAKLADLNRALDTAAQRHVVIPFSSETHSNGTFADGGYTGDGGKWQPKGVVHGGEFVINKEQTAKWRPVLERINDNHLLPGYAYGGYVGGNQASAGGNGGVTFNVGTINARDENAAAERLLTKARDNVAAYGLTRLGV